MFEIARHQLLPFAAAFPTRDNPSGSDDPAVFELVRKPPEERGTP